MYICLCTYVIHNNTYIPFQLNRLFPSVLAVNIPIRKYFVCSYTKYLFTALATLATRLSEFLLDGPLVQLHTKLMIIITNTYNKIRTLLLSSYTSISYTPSSP